jgi:pimeloyl-ACP methyl ester carboxylesterase
LEFVDSDILFFGYDGRDTRAGSLAQEFAAFLEPLCVNPYDLVFAPSLPSFDRVNGVAYEEVWVVAHSLGALVTRLALLRGRSLRASWMSITKMLLFAPAHNGAHTADLLRHHGLAELILQTIGAFGKYSVLLDLMTDSPTIRKLKTDTEVAIREGNSDYLRAGAVVHASADSVVPVIDFDHDPPLTSIRNRDHTSICKPERADDPVFQAFRHTVQ